MMQADKLPVAAPEPQPEKRCQYCDGTGDVHSIDGEWRGECHCQKQPQPEAVPGMVPPIVAEIMAEVARATRKFPTWPTDPLHALAVLGEEFGELTKDALQLTYEPHKTSMSNVRKEALQTAAMAIRWAMSLDKYEYAQCAQHSQQIAAATKGDTK